MLPLTVGGELLHADPSGALLWPAESTLIVADLHLEKGSSFARRGVFLPPYDTRTTLARLEALIRRLAPSRIVALGDSFHDREAAARLDPADAAALAEIVARQDWIWVAGNHDPMPPSGLGGAIVREAVTLRGLTFRHEAVFEARGPELSGHFHPKASLRVHGRRVSCRCFVADGDRVILPAFGAYAGGLDIRETAVMRLFPKGFTAYLTGTERVTALPSALLRLPEPPQAALPLG
jgi:DNA ligase-associated metallophosphoesterase